MWALLGTRCGLWQPRGPIYDRRPAGSRRDVDWWEMMWYTVGAWAVRQLLPALHQLSQGQDADGPRHRGDRLAAAGAGRHRGDAGVPARPAAAQPSVVAAGQQRPRAGTLRRPGRTHGICLRPRVMSAVLHCVRCAGIMCPQWTDKPNPDPNPVTDITHCYTDTDTDILLWPPYGIGQAIIFSSGGFFLSSSFFVFFLA